MFPNPKDRSHKGGLPSPKDRSPKGGFPSPKERFSKSDRKSPKYELQYLLSFQHLSIKKMNSKLNYSLFDLFVIIFYRGLSIDDSPRMDEMPKARPRHKTDIFGKTDQVDVDLETDSPSVSRFHRGAPGSRNTPTQVRRMWILQLSVDSELQVAGILPHR
jgi:hypothetical protein